MIQSLRLGWFDRHKSRQVLILGPETIQNPRTHARSREQCRSWTDTPRIRSKSGTTNHTWLHRQQHRDRRHLRPIPNEARTAARKNQQGIDATDYDFTESVQAVQAGDTATIGFWQNKHGQALIKQGGPALVSWLSTNFGNIFGSTFTDGSGGDDADEVAGFYKDEFFKKKIQGAPKVDAQFMALALGTFFTSSNLSGGTVASGYGFHVTETGIGTKVVNVRSKGAAFNVADHSHVTIMSLLLATNSMTGADADGDAAKITATSMTPTATGFWTTMKSRCEPWPTNFTRPSTKLETSSQVSAQPLTHSTFTLRTPRAQHGGLIHKHCRHGQP